ncbi:hypothetical protein ASA1KI_35910 [Opitutales bacterium ASA1]|uniref:hypothetical protein n=1 Tax=Congregicoccus parvus TaxID=3081749 RepID=UPI002B301610|nr:hypothetical protein ASA1KI_35910 [Opitutales bacterium ASA1]
MPFRTLREHLAKAMLAVGLPVGAAVSAQPIRLHPENPRYFEWRGRPLVLVTSAEHYGAVLNRAFDFERYLAALQRDGMNYTRVFTGAYVEPQGAFGIERNTLAPAAGDYLSPWVQVRPMPDAPPVHDLENISGEYLDRMKAFLASAARRGVVVEITFFSSTYGEAQWQVHPFNPRNNLQRIDVPEWKRLHTTEAPEQLQLLQEKLVRTLVRELRGFDNVFFEIQNEPWSDNPIVVETLNPLLANANVYPNVVEIPAPISVAWQRRMAAAIADEQREREHPHMVAQNVSNFRLPVRDDDLVPGVSIVNFHYAHPEAASWNRGLPLAFGYDESGFSGREDTPYRVGAWRFVMAGGALFNNLDYSFSVGHEDGDDTTNVAPGGGGPELRRQLGVLSRFIHSFDLATLGPMDDVVVRAPGVVPLVLGTQGHQYAVHLLGRGPTNLELRLPAGTYRAEWLDPRSGEAGPVETIRVDRQTTSLRSPEFASEAALRLIVE